jgi:hypothetical protein
VFAIVGEETKQTFASSARAVFVMKVLGGDPSPAER